MAHTPIHEYNFNPQPKPPRDHSPYVIQQDDSRNHSSRPSSNFSSFYNSQQNILGPSKIFHSGSNHSLNSSYSNDHQHSNNVFTCDHLTTFKLPNQMTLETKNYLDKLNQLDQLRGFKRVRLTVASSKVIVHDVKNGDFIEEFPVEVVKNLETVQRAGPNFNNLIVFNVFERNINEVHIFQCLGRPGKEFEVEIEKAKKAPILKRKPPQRPLNFNNYMPTFPADLTDPYGKKQISNGFQTFRGGIQKQLLNESDQSSRQVKILNYLFADIEAFINNLSQIAYDHDLSSKGSDRHSGYGDNTMNNRLRQLQAKDFVEVLMMFKLSFIIIAKLKRIICNPNAPELVHLLFKPLSLIVNTNLISNQSGISLARNVINPLITDEVINLLENCLETKESQLWDQLGDAWKKTSYEWPEKLPLYQPIFKDGWSPPIKWMSEIISPSNSPNNTFETRHIQNQFASPLQRSPPTSIYATSSSSSSGIASLNDRFLKRLLKENKKVYVAKMDCSAKNDKEISLSAGDIVEVIKDDKNWWRVRNCRNEVGYAPKNTLQPYDQAAMKKST